MGCFAIDWWKRHLKMRAVVFKQNDLAPWFDYESRFFFLSICSVIKRLGNGSPPVNNLIYYKAVSLHTDAVGM